MASSLTYPGSFLNWDTVVCEPAILTNIIKKLGVSGARVEELWSLKTQHVNKIKPIHGFVCLIKNLDGSEIKGTPSHDVRADRIFFPRLIIRNACPTQGILTVLFNCKHSDVSLGKNLFEFKDMAQGLDSNMKGLTFTNSDTIRAVHNVVARQKRATFNQVGHFICYIPFEGRLYELSSVKVSPTDLGSIPADMDWTEFACPVIASKIHQYKCSKIEVNVMAVVSDKAYLYERKIHHIARHLENSNSMETNIHEAEIAHLRLLIEEEERIMHEYRTENVRTKHNYSAFIMELIKIADSEGMFKKGG